MAKAIFKSYNPNDSLLFPPCIGDFIGDNAPVRVLNAVVDNLDLSVIESSTGHALTCFLGISACQTIFDF